jgi:hypothetical protein
MKPFEYYSKSTIPYPNKKDYVTIFVYNAGKVVWQGPDSEFSNSNPEVATATSGKYVTQKVTDEEGYIKAQLEYGKEDQKLHAEFQNDLFEEFGVVDNPKRFRAFSYAWQEGHAGGYADVYNVFADIVELIREDS